MRQVVNVVDVCGMELVWMAPPCLFPSLIFVLLAYCSAADLSLPPLLGVHPLDEKYFESEVIKCKDGSKSFTKNRVNDNFCDCFDGTDEPGTSACPKGRFYCKNVGSVPKFLFSSHVNDHICDCCDGTDEYDSSVNCPNTCIMGGNLDIKSGNYRFSSKYRNNGDVTGSKVGWNLEEMIQNIRDLRILSIFQLFFVCFLLALCLLRYRARMRRRR